MERMNNKGFTLIELVATVVLLILVMGIGAFSITKIINNSKEKDYQLLIKNIKDAAEEYYLECKYGDVSDDILVGCNDLDNVSLYDLVLYGYLTGNSKDSDNKYTLVNPNNGESIAGCKIKIVYNDGNVNVQEVGTDTKCPSDY